MNKIDKIQELWSKMKPAMMENEEKYSYLTESDKETMHQIRLILKNLNNDL